MKKILLLAVLLLLATQLPVSVEAAGQAVILNNHTGFFDSLGYYHVVGEVQNTGDGALQYVKITATFYDSGGAVVATSFTYTMIEILHAGQKSPFDVFLFDKAQSAKVDHYALSVSYDQSGGLPVGLEILSHSKYEDLIGWIHVVGEIKNIGDREAHYVKVVATFYDSAGKVVGAFFGYSDPEDLAPGQKAPFEILLQEDRAKLVTTYALEAQSSEYNIIPEFPTIAILPIVVLLALCVLRVRLLHKRNRVP